MYLVTKHNTKIAEWSEERHLRGTIDDLGQIIKNNEVYRDYIASKDTGKPGHYYGRDVMLEGSMPAAAFILAEQEFGGDPDWFKDDRKFQDFMKRHPAYNWLNG